MRLEDLKGRRLGRYEILEVLGRGGMAAVYRARDTVLRRDVALKVLYPQYTGDVALVERFQREAVLAAGLDHSNILPIYDVGDTDGMVYIAMRLLSGQSFADVLRLRGTIPPAELLPIVDQVAAALDYAHARQIVHRDIKPANILIDGDRMQALASARAILTDFGIAKSLDAAARGLTATGVLIGTPEYMAPEQIRGGHKVDARADIYALGVVVYRALTGHRPFEGSTEEVLIGHLHGSFAPPSALERTLPPALDGVLQRVLRRDPAQRYQSAGEFARALRSAAGLEMPTPPPAIRRTSDGRVVVPAVAIGGVGGGGTTVPQATLQGNAAPPRRAEPLAPRMPASQAPRTLPPPREGSGSAAAWVMLGLILALVIGGGGLYAAGLLYPRNAAALPATPIQPTAPLATLQPTVPLAATQAPATEEPAKAPASAPTKAPTKAPTAAPSATPSATPTPEPTAVPPTPTPTEPPCPIEIGAKFTDLLANRPELADRLGCAAQDQQARAVAEQSFQRGQMLWLAGPQAGNGTIYVIQAAEAQSTRLSWQSFEDTWHAGDPEDSGDSVPPDGLIEPIRGFGKLWYANDTISGQLGWGVSGEKAATGAVQRFANGRLIFSPLGFEAGAAVYVLYQNGTFETYPL